MYSNQISLPQSVTLKGVQTHLTVQCFISLLIIPRYRSVHPNPLHPFTKLSFITTQGCSQSFLIACGEAPLHQTDILSAFEEFYLENSLLLKHAALKSAPLLKKGWQQLC